LPQPPHFAIDIWRNICGFDNTDRRRNRPAAEKTFVDPVLDAEGRHLPTPLPRNDLCILKNTVAASGGIEPALHPDR
jgi:hypothetical protein